MTIAWSPICLNAAYDPRANPALTGTPLTETARSVRGMPTRKTSPACTWPDLPSACSTAFQSGSAARARPGVPEAMSAASTISCPSIRSLMAISSCDSRAVRPGGSVELLGHRLPLRAFQEGDLGHRVVVLHRRHDGHGAESRVGLHGLGGRRGERALGLRHHLALGPRVLEVVVLGDRLGLGDLPGLVVDDHLGELLAPHRVHRELQLAVLDLVL